MVAAAAAAAAVKQQEAVAMMRRPPARPGLGKKPSGAGFKITYSMNQLLSMGKELMESEAGCQPPEGWEKYQYETIG